MLVDERKTTADETQEVKPRPVLFAVHDDSEALGELETQLGRRYAHDYSIEAFTGSDEARLRLADLAESSVDVVAVFAPASLQDAADVFDLARHLHPHAKRALLVPANGWLDPETADAIRTSMALGRIDQYVLQPAASPDEVFHESISELLLEWSHEQLLVPQTVHIVGEQWSGRAYELREAFAGCAVPHTFCLADSNEGRELVARAGADAKLPLMALPDGRILSDPSNAEIAEAAGAPQALGEQTYDLVVVGAGPAGLSAAVYGASEGLRVLVVDKAGIGGQVRSSSLIRNYLGFGRGISGARLAHEAYQQAFSFGAHFLFLHQVTALNGSAGSFVLSLSDGRTVDAKAVVLAMGASYRRLGIAPLEALAGAGVFYGGPTSEAPALTGKDTYVVGGGNSAGQAALHLARFARQVTLVVRAGSLERGMSHYLVETIAATPNVRVRTDTTIVGGGGEGHLEQLMLRNGTTGEQEMVAADALFVLIGARPQTDWLPDGISRDRHGFLLTGDDIAAEDWPLERRPLPMETSLPGVVAIGDIRSGSLKRVAAAVGAGSIAVQMVHRLIDAA